jgi:hypothetical protein
MITAWTSHLKTEEEKKQFLSEVQGSRRVLNRLLQLINQREGAIDLVERSVKQFEVPNWDYRQAFYNGGKSELNLIKSIVDLDPKETK